MIKTLNIGRDESNDVVIKDPTVSRNHGVLYLLENGQVLFEDLNSLNGSFVQGNRVYGKIELKKGEILKVGKALVPWQNYLKQTVYETPISKPPRTSVEPYPHNPQSNLLKYWPVAIAMFVIIIISVLMFQGSSKSNKKSEKEKSNNKEISTAKNENNSNQQENSIKSPIDSDKDGVFDDEDECPNKKGSKSNQGCPLADYDSDGIPDRDDDCKFEFGPKWNQGCPYEDYEEDGYRTKCPYCNLITFESTTNKWWDCGVCGKSFYNCYRSNLGDHDGIKSEWFDDGECDCYSCIDEN